MHIHQWMFAITLSMATLAVCISVCIFIMPVLCSAAMTTYSFPFLFCLRSFLPCKNWYFIYRIVFQISRFRFFTTSNNSRCLLIRITTSSSLIFAVHDQPKRLKQLFHFIWNIFLFDNFLQKLLI